MSLLTTPHWTCALCRCVSHATPHGHVHFVGIHSCVSRVTICGQVHFAGIHSCISRESNRLKQEQRGHCSNKQVLRCASLGLVAAAHYYLHPLLNP